MNIDEIRVEVFKRTGFNIEPHDPFYSALVMFNLVATDIEKKNETALELISNYVKGLSENQVHVLSKSETQLNRSVFAIQQSVQQIAGVQNGIEQSVGKQADALLNPLIRTLCAVLESLKEKDGLALEHLRKTQATQARWAANAGLAIGGVVIALLIVGAGSYFAGLTLAQKKIAKTAEWLDSGEGKYAVYLKDAGLLKPLTTCNSGNVEITWKKSRDGKTCYMELSDGKTIIWNNSN